jgi:hypothetical protein
LGPLTNVRLLIWLTLSGAATCAIAQQHAGKSVAAASVAEVFSKLPAEARLEPLPAELKTESAIFLQRRLGEWQAEDAREVLGEPRRHRDAYEQGVVTGNIFAFRDPTGRYREFELLFDRKTRILKSAYIYPWRMNWDECRELWGEAVNTTTIANGNVFRSYLNRRLDVLVDKAGTVINLGIY